MKKKTVVAGSFYPKEKELLLKMLNYLFLQAKTTPISKHQKPLAIVVPHAGYIFSGQIAASAYTMIQGYDYKKVVLIAPSHTNHDHPFFIGKYEEYETPFGNIKTEPQLINYFLAKKEFCFDTFIDKKEHALEVQLPFIYYLNPEIFLIPILFCQQELSHALLLSNYLNNIYTEDTLFIISTDLSHYHSATTAEKLDQTLIKDFAKLDLYSLVNNYNQQRIEACGIGGILTIVDLATRLGNVAIYGINYAHSGMFSGDYTQVVGYFSCGLFH